tara:strand:- start:477 stop:1034 length:558 start_codon:yes stop_codon:yes gene_type:complete
MESITIELNPADLNWCLEYAEKIVAHYGKKGDKGSGSYNHNKVSSNLVGFKSEVATKKWLGNEIGLEQLNCHYEDYLNPNPNGDIEVLNNGLEIKGLRPIHWDKFKRCIPPRQLTKYVKNEAIAVWCVTTGDVENPTVVLKGWNYCWEVEKYGKFIHTICPNIWLEEDDKMRSMDELLDLLLVAC